jgi:GT2 family glycosyltransferase
LFLLLDDDNLISNNTISELIKHWNMLNKKYKYLMLLANRTIRSDRYYKFADQKKIKLSKNCFCYFNIFNIINYIKGIFFKQSPNFKNTKKNSWEIADWYYWWMFFNKELIDKIWLPNEKFFLYWDDTEFCYKVRLNWWKIFFIKKSIITDNEASRNTSKKQNYLDQILWWDKFRVYYWVRNRVFLEKNYLLSNKFIYNINKFLFYILYYVYSIITRQNNNKKLIAKAIKDWENNILWKTFIE